MGLFEQMALAGRNPESEGDLENQLNNVMDRAVLTYLKLYGLEQLGSSLFADDGTDTIDPFDVMGKIAGTGAQGIIGKILKIRGFS